MANPYADAWEFPAIDYVDGCAVEHWTRHRDGMSTPSGWWSLSEADFHDLSRTWHAAGKRVSMGVRYRDDESVFSTYPEFGDYYANAAQTAQATLTPSLWNYHTPAWLELYQDYQDNEGLPVDTPELSLAERVAILEIEVAELRAELRAENKHFRESIVGGLT